VHPVDRTRRLLVELQRIVRAAAEEAGLPPDAPLPFDALEIPLVGPPPAPAAGPASRALFGSLVERLVEAQRGRSAFRPGAVYCFQCDVPDCGHDRPAGPDQVFAGYGATGRPEWQAFQNVLIEANDPRVERVYADPPEVVAVVRTGAELSGELLPSFGRGSRAFRVVGQVAAGLFDPAAFSLDDGRGRFALALQVVLTEGYGPARLELNVVGPDPDALAQGAAHGGPRSRAEWLRRTLFELRHVLDVLSRKAADARPGGTGAYADLDVEVARLLGRVRVDLERVFRPERGRTVHAMQRHREGGRPTSFAHGDALEAPADRFYRDAERGTVVVLGPRGRAHVFAVDGRLVTSLVLGPNEFERKFTRTRWQPLARAAVETFRALVRG
jgi:hypothetical protein